MCHNMKYKKLISSGICNKLNYEINITEENNICLYIYDMNISCSFDDEVIKSRTNPFGISCSHLKNIGLRPMLFIKNKIEDFIFDQELN